MNKPSVVIGMSGGVDSSVAAFILKEQGFDVTGVFMKNWEEDDNPTSQYCNAAQDLTDAQQVCDVLKIKLHKVNFATEYWDRVFSVFLEEYQAGRTPNPDVLCNKEIKFKMFLDYAKQLHSDFIATGHYARILTKHHNTYLLTAIDQDKDQSYFLHALTSEQLSNCIFPLGELTKKAVRNIANKVNLHNFNKKDSTGICFIGERKFKQFLEKYLPNQPGDIVDEQDNILGSHDGLMYHTIGQRKGLKIGGQTKYQNFHQPWYVIGKDLPNNKLIVANGNNHLKLFARKLKAIKPHWINQDIQREINNQDEFVCMAKVRYRQISQSCSVKIINDSNELLVTFFEPQRAITPGQYIVFYQQDYCLGGAIIEQAL